CEQEQRPVRKPEAAEQAEREPIGRRLRQPEREVEVPALPQHPIPERRGAGGNLVLQGAVVPGWQAGVAQRRVAGGVRERVPASPRRARSDENRQPAPPRRVAELLAHRVAARRPDVETERNDERALLRGQPGEGAERRWQSLPPQGRVEGARGRESLAARASRRIRTGVPRV